MNVTELARQIRMNTTELLEILPQYGFDIGRKAIKIDDRMGGKKEKSLGKKKKRQLKKKKKKKNKQKKQQQKK